jgi:hypothetical protein
MMNNNLDNLPVLVEEQKNLMAKKLSEVYNWNYEELMAMDYSALYDTYSERYLDYIYGV